MPSEDKNKVTISKNNSGFPAYLDFDKLRSEGIAYLGKLSGQLWTDHNVHDPGITILEVLCYALLDLGYRTNLPIEDILARDTADISEDNNFFTLAQVLTCNPLTINDYRKLLIDIPGVKNTWLTPATDIKDRCKREVIPVTDRGDDVPDHHPGAHPNETKPQQALCTEFLNGLYHVYIEADKDLQKGSKDWKDLLELIKKTLMAHRNLCEDFEDIYLLCRLETGVCASIELAENTNAENVYLAIMTKLSEFFSPAPTFYTLPELLEKGKPIEDIFAGRPFSAESHGFVDTAELEKIKLRKEIHTSDVYNAIFEVEGVSSISKLSLRSCGKECNSDSKERKSSWKFHIPENHIPVFSIACSGFEFTKNGLPITVDTEKFETLLALGLTHTGKVLNKTAAPSYDNKIPQGIYHKELKDYYSIQNDFPRIYGIAEGGLSDDSPNFRKAQALQLKGYLLFFDQILANYVSQLKNIRQLFQFKGVVNKKDQHTYFLNTLNTVPELSKLLRFGTGESDNSLGSSGSVLVFPVSRDKWDSLNTKLLSGEKIFQSLVPYSFNSRNALDEATSLLRDDLMIEGESATKAYQTADNCWLFTISSSAEKWILLGRKIATSESEALQQGASVQYSGVFENNYRSFLTANNQFTFNVELNLVSYTDYLGLLVENDDLYFQRRKQFLQHLLSRFAEKFTDFTLLNWKNGSEHEGLTGVERFLTHYDEISRNRGKAYDYRVDGWHNDNLSGFEQKVKAMAGIEGWGKNNLCPFTVDPHDEQYVLTFQTVNDEEFIFSEKYDLKEDAIKSAASLTKALADPTHFQVKPSDDKKAYRLLIHYGGLQPGVYSKTFSSRAEVDNLQNYLVNSFSQIPPKDAVAENSWVWKINLLNFEGTIVKTAIESWHQEKDAEKASHILAGKINDPKNWIASKESVPKELYFDKHNTLAKKFIDVNEFKIDISATILRKPGMFTYDVLDMATYSFKLQPVVEFNTAKQAKDHCLRILGVATDITNYHIVLDKETNLYSIKVKADEKGEAFCVIRYNSKKEAEEAVTQIFTIVNRYTYSLQFDISPDTWKFNYKLGYQGNTNLLFQSLDTYQSIENAYKAAGIFYENIADLSQTTDKGIIRLENVNNKSVASVIYLSPNAEEPLPNKIIEKELLLQNKIAKISSVGASEHLQHFYKVDGVGEFGTFVYRLVDKNHVPAVYTHSFGDELTAKEHRKELASYTKQAIRAVPEICLGGDIFQEVKDKKGNKWYRYQLKLHHLSGAPGNHIKRLDELVLFESTKGFPTKEEASSAFKINYLKVLHLATDASQYGKSISLKPIPIKEKDEYNTDEALVFIPKDTLPILQYDWGASTWSVGLANYLKFYPIKRIDPDSEEFAAMYCREFVEKDKTCPENEIKWVYYFSIPINIQKNTKGPLDEWRSTKHYSTPSEAMQDFRFFTRLVKYTGNYYTDCACTMTYETDKKTFITSYDYKIFIREVLAESINWFKSPEDPWGSEGIEKFICAVQSPDAFKNYLRKSDCCYSFYVTCGNGLLEHPCKYDTHHQRDEALELLHQKWEEYNLNDSYSWSSNDQSIFLHNQKGKPFSQMPTDRNTGHESCDLFINLAEAILEGDYTPQYSEGWLMYSVERHAIKIQSVEQRILEDKADQEKWKEEWKRILINWACHYPITRSKLNGPTNQSKNIAGNEFATPYKYCIEIKLPGFNSCAEDAERNKPCTCNEQLTQEPACYIAWKGVCCYSSCQQAMEALKKAYEHLANKKNYHPIFDCDCNSFGINLHTNNPILVRSSTTIEKDSHIIAINPQCYNTQDEVCKAVEKARKLVNSEGMHLAEHILLRPHCEADCRCREGVQNCTIHCDFPPYPSGDKDPCSEKPKEICFKPGTDPYSFIATVALPAWSYRFRQQKNRQILENLIYREAPAHVLLRILWLKPKDLCRYETLFKNWNKYLAGKHTCNGDFDPCRFLDFLFKQHFECLAECVECQPCTEIEVGKVSSCIEEEKKHLTKADLTIRVANQYKFLNQVNEVFCLEKYCHQEDQPGSVIGSKVDIKNIALAEKEASTPKKTPPKHPTQDARTIKAAPQITEQPAIVIPAVGKQQSPGKQLITKIVNSRRTKYNDAVADVLANTQGNVIASKVTSFLSSSDPNVVALENLTIAIIQNEKTGSRVIKKLTNHQKVELLKAAICFYLDKICFGGQAEERMAALQKVTKRMLKAGIDLQPIFDYWDAAEVATFGPKMNIDYIRNIFIVKNKKK